MEYDGPPGVIILVYDNRHAEISSNLSANSDANFLVRGHLAPPSRSG